MSLSDCKFCFDTILLRMTRLPGDPCRYRVLMLDSVLVISVLDTIWMSYATKQNDKSHVMSRWNANRLFKAVVMSMWEMIRRFPLVALSAIQDIGLVCEFRHRSLSSACRWTSGDSFGNSPWWPRRRFKKVNYFDMVTVDVIGLSRCFPTRCCC